MTVTTIANKIALPAHRRRPLTSMNVCMRIHFPYVTHLAVATIAVERRAPLLKTYFRPGRNAARAASGFDQGQSLPGARGAATIFWPHRLGACDGAVIAMFSLPPGRGTLLISGSGASGRQFTPVGSAQERRATPGPPPSKYSSLITWAPPESATSTV